MRSSTSISGRILIVTDDVLLAPLHADRIAINCPGVRIDICTSRDSSAIEDNAGGADVAICTCAPGATGFDALRTLLTTRPCLHVLTLIPADRPALADEAIARGASDALLTAPGYLDQIAVAVRKGIALSRRAIAARAREASLAESLRRVEANVREFAAPAAAPLVPDALPTITIRGARAKAA